MLVTFSLVVIVFFKDVLKDVLEEVFPIFIAARMIGHERRFSPTL
jgi:hypothetical protein